MLDAKTLHETARNVDAPTPAAFAAAVERVRETEQTKTDALVERDELIREARQIGVSWVALSRWTGLDVRHLHRIVNDR